ncbi:MAG: DUF4388 domain-containing protein [Candidatus Zixiibacteriota bacterium]
MVKEKSKPRLDEILLSEGLISEKQIKHALERQKSCGGKFGSQLLHHGDIDEAGLVKALAIQFACDGVVLSRLEIPDIILKFIPRRLAVARKVVPFDYDIENNLLKIACEDPNDDSLVNEICFVTRGKKIKLYIAAEIALNNAIAKYYLGKEVGMADSVRLEVPNGGVGSGKIPIAKEAAASAVNSAKVNGDHVLLVTDDKSTAPHLQALLHSGNYQVTICDSADDAIDILGMHQFHSVFIKDTVSGDYLDLIDRLRKISPDTVVRYYESASALLLEDDVHPVEENLLRRNLELYTYLLNARDKLPSDHTCVMGSFADKLCARMQIPYKDRLAIVNAAYVHDVARHYYNVGGPTDRDQLAALTIKLLRSLGYSPVVIAMLRCMYKDLKGKYTKRLPVEILGGNILTVVNIFAGAFEGAERLSLDRLDTLQKKLRDQAGSLLLPEVVEAFISLLKDEILKFHSTQNALQIMLFSRMPDVTRAVEERLKNAGYRIIGTDSVAKFSELYERSRPDIIILAPDNEASYLMTFLDELMMREISFDKTPTFIMKSGVPSGMLLSLFELGVEDVIATDGNLELLVAKIDRLAQRLQTKKDEVADMDKANGSLAHSSLTELINILAGGQRTAKLTVTPTQSPDKPLVIFFGYGSIVFARLDKLVGEEAIYTAAGWVDGEWNVETVKEDDLPSPNVTRSDETIQMNTFRILRESTKAPKVE